MSSFAIINSQKFCTETITVSYKVKDFERGQKELNTNTDIVVADKRCLDVEVGNIVDVSLHAGTYQVKAKGLIASRTNTETTIQLQQSEIDFVSDEIDFSDLDTEIFAWDIDEYDAATNFTNAAYRGFPFYPTVKYYGGLKDFSHGDSIQENYLDFFYVTPDVYEYHLIQLIKTQIGCVISRFFETEFFKHLTISISNCANYFVLRRSVITHDTGLIQAGVQNFVTDYTAAGTVYVQPSSQGLRINIKEKYTFEANIFVDTIFSSNANEKVILTIDRADNNNIPFSQLIFTDKQTFELQKGDNRIHLQQDDYDENVILRFSYSVTFSGSVTINAFSSDFQQGNPTNVFIDTKQLYKDFNIAEYLESLEARFNLVSYYDSVSGCLYIDPAETVVLNTGEKVDALYEQFGNTYIFNKNTCDVIEESTITDKQLSVSVYSHNNDIRDINIDEEDYQYMNRVGDGLLEGEIQDKLLSTTYMSNFPISITNSTPANPFYRVPFMIDDTDAVTKEAKKYCYKKRYLFALATLGTDTSPVRLRRDNTNFPRSLTYSTFFDAATYELPSFQLGTVTIRGINLGFDTRNGVKGLAETFYKRSIERLSGRKLKIQGTVCESDIQDIKKLLLSYHYFAHDTISGYFIIEEISFTFEKNAITYNATLIER